MLQVPTRQLSVSKFALNGHWLKGTTSYCDCEHYLDKMEYFSYNGEKYTNHPNSVNDHYRSILGDIENKILAVGGLSTSNNKVELFDISSNT